MSFELTRLNLVYDVLQTTKISSNTSNGKRDKRVGPISFVICNSCYWCASYFEIDASYHSSSSPACHACNCHDTELMPIFTEESFRIEYNPPRGMEIEFYRRYIDYWQKTLN